MWSDTDAHISPRLDLLVSNTLSHDLIAFDLAIVIPTYNEAQNVPVLLARLAAVLTGINWQAIVVDDDSPDGTWRIVDEISASAPRVRCIRRQGRRGLAGAVTEGILAAGAPTVAVIDADLQHDETRLPVMFAAIAGGPVDLVIASRYVTSPQAAAGFSAIRAAGSRLANRLASLVLGARVTDPMSGFFMIRRELVEAIAERLTDKGFKILFDIIASQPTPLRILEVPYNFSSRQAGESKLDHHVVLDYLTLLFSALIAKFWIARACLFLAVGASGLLVQLAVMRLVLAFHIAFDLALVAGGLTAMTSNFWLNNSLTYRDRRLKGRKLWQGYLRFCLLCAVPLAINFTVAHLVFQQTKVWWQAGIAGAILGAIWNYVSTASAVW